MRVGGLAHGLDDGATAEEVEEACERIGEIRIGFADALAGLGLMLKDAPGYEGSSRFYLGGLTLGLAAVTKALGHSMPTESELIAASNVAISRRKTGGKKARK